MSLLHAVILDDSNGSLADVVLLMIRSGIAPFYAKWLDEALLMAEQERGRIELLVVNATASARSVQTLRSRVAALCGDEPRLLAIGPSESTEVRAQAEALSPDGILWSPVREAELRFLVNAALYTPDKNSCRGDERAPLETLAWLDIGGRQVSGVIHSISTVGAFMEIVDSPAVGSQVSARFSLPSDRQGIDLPMVCVSANVVREKSESCAGNRSNLVGVGLRFDKLDSETEDIIRGYVDRALARIHASPAERITAQRGLASS